MSKFTQEFLPQILMSWYNSGVFWYAVALSFQMVLPEKSYICRFWAQRRTLLIAIFFLFKSISFVKSNYFFQNSLLMIFLDQIYMIVLPRRQVLTKKNWKCFFGPYLLPKMPNILKYKALKKLCLVHFCQKR